MLFIPTVKNQNRLKIKTNHRFKRELCIEVFKIKIYTKITLKKAVAGKVALRYSFSLVYAVDQSAHKVYRKRI